MSTQQLTNLRVTNKMVLPINTNLATINGYSLIDLRERRNIVIPGSGGYTIITVNFASSPYTILPTTGITLYQVDCTSGNVIMNFPTAIGSNAIWGIKKIDSSLNTITLEPFGTQTIDGNSNQTILFQNTQVDVYSNNINLFIK